MLAKKNGNEEERRKAFMDE
jgi:hypothetical protein